MNKQINFGQVSGRLTVEPKDVIKVTEKGNYILNFGVAVKGYTKDTFINLTAFNKDAIDLSENFSKGEEITLNLRIKQKIQKVGEKNHYGYDFDILSFKKGLEVINNDISIEGKIIKDVVVKELNTEKTVANVTVVLKEENRKDQFLNLSFWDEKAKSIAEKAEKGDVLQASLSIRKKIDKLEGINVYTHDFNVKSYNVVKKEAKAPWEDEAI